MDSKLRIGSKTIKLLEETIDSMFFNISLSSIFFNLFPLARVTEVKTNKQKMGLHQTKNLLQGEGNCQHNEEAAY